jgi:6-methylsalicylate decarboxylase
MSTTHERIDVHTHVVPPFWAQALGENGGDPSGWKTPTWNPEAHLEFMDANEIATSILSLTAPSVVGWPEPERRDMARRVNEYTGQLVTDQPLRFGNFATLPLPDVEGAVAEAAYALDEIKADGVVLLTNYNGDYLGHPRFTPLWRELDARSAVVFIHPGHPLIATLPDVPGPLVDYPYDSTRNAVHMVFNGVLDDFPNVTIILSHAGGFLPYAVTRFCLLRSALEPEGPSADELEAKFKKFHFDTALSSGPYAMPSLLAFADPTRIHYGSDFPYAPAVVGTRFTELLDTDPAIAEHSSGIARDNALTLFPRLR